MRGSLSSRNPIVRPSLSSGAKIVFLETIQMLRKNYDADLRPEKADCTLVRRIGGQAMWHPLGIVNPAIRDDNI